jgi:G3E family GTPase
MNASHPSLHLITGYLGSGKTTFLCRLLEKQVLHESIAIIVNDFGDMVYDALLLRSAANANSNANTFAHAPSKPMTILDVPGGCLCCSAIDDFKDALNQVLRQGYTRVFIEATGLADAEQVRADLAYMGFPVESTLCVVDALNYERLAALFPTVEHQAEAADVLLVAKTDLASKSDVERVHGLLRAVNSRAAMVYMKQGFVPSDFLVTAFAPAERFATTHEPHSHQEHLLRDGITAFRVCWSVEEAPCSLDDVEAALQALPPSVLRVKGTLQLCKDEGRSMRDEAVCEQWLVNYICGRLEFVEVVAEIETQAQKPFMELFVIGRNLDESSVKAWFPTAEIQAGTLRGRGLVEAHTHEHLQDESL